MDFLQFHSAYQQLNLNRNNNNIINTHYHHSPQPHQQNQNQVRSTLIKPESTYFTDTYAPHNSVPDNNNNNSKTKSPTTQKMAVATFAALRIMPVLNIIFILVMIAITIVFEIEKKNISITKDFSVAGISGIISIFFLLTNAIAYVFIYHQSLKTQIKMTPISAEDDDDGLDDDNVTIDVDPETDNKRKSNNSKSAKKKHQNNRHHHQRTALSDESEVETLNPRQQNETNHKDFEEDTKEEKSIESKDEYSKLRARIARYELDIQSMTNDYESKMHTMQLENEQRINDLHTSYVQQSLVIAQTPEQSPQTTPQPAHIELNNKVTDLKRQLNVKTARVSEVEELNANLRAENEEYTMNHEKLKLQMQQITENESLKFQELKDNFDAIEYEHNSLKSQSQITDQSLKQKENKIDELMLEHKDLRSKMEAHSLTIEELQNTKLESDNAHLKSFNLEKQKSISSINTLEVRFEKSESQCKLYLQTCEELEQRLQILQNEMECKDIEIQELKQQQQIMVSKHEQSMAAVAETDADEENIQEIVEKLRKDLSNAQKTILEMTSVVGVQQKFPTAQETIHKYRALRDQTHHDTSSILKKFLKEQNPAWQKYYINQCIHEIMFYILLTSYSKIVEFHQIIFKQIARILQMPAVIADAHGIILNTAAADINTNNKSKSKKNNKKTKKNRKNSQQSRDEEFISQEEIRILSNIFGSYFKTNYTYILNGKLKNPNMDDDDEDYSDDELSTIDITQYKGQHKPRRASSADVHIKTRKLNRKSASRGGGSAANENNLLLPSIVNRKMDMRTMFETRSSSGHSSKLSAFYLVDYILQLTFRKFKQHLKHLPENATKALLDYICKCCEICWVMILQEPPLSIMPFQWKAILVKQESHDENENGNENGNATEHEIKNDDQSEAAAANNNNNNNTDNDDGSASLVVEEPEAYDDSKHKRVLGSDRHCKQILYHVWPAIVRKNTEIILGEQKVDVVLRNVMYTPTKMKKRKSSASSTADSPRKNSGQMRKKGRKNSGGNK